MSLLSCLFWRSLAIAVVPLATSLVPSPADAGAHPGPTPVDNVRTGPTSAWALRRALETASRYLAQPECQRVFSEFKDRKGRPLQEALDSQAKTGAAFLGSLLFYDGAHLARCRLKQTYAVGSPESRVVFICPDQFQEIAVRRPRFAGVVLIHESLHALGLGENPPTSGEITNRVMDRCLP